MLAMNPPWEQPQAIELAVAMAQSYFALVGEPLLGGPGVGGDAMAAALFVAPFGLLCHDGGLDPRFIYANDTAQRMWKMNWATLVGLPSRLSAEVEHRGTRTEMLAEAAAVGYIRDYAGIRVDAHGERFAISEATIWTVTDESGRTIGQAARLPKWQPLAAGE